MLLLRHLKSYLPAHSILRGFVALHLCDFADAIRAGCAEAKQVTCLLPFICVPDAIRAGCAEAKKYSKLFITQEVHDAIRAGCAEAKKTGLQHQRIRPDAIRVGCAEAKPCLHSLPRLISMMQSVRDVPKRTESHCIQTIMRRTMK